MKVAWGALRGWARRRLGALRWRTVLVLLAFVCVVAYAGLLAPHRPLFGWVRVVPLDFDEPQGAPVPGKRNIFFMETSCIAADPPHDAPFISESGLRLSPRSACAVEAAAAANPLRPVYLAHSCPVDAVRMWQGGAPAYALAAVSLPNVHVWPFRAPDQFRDSPLSEWFANGGKGDAGKRWWVTRVRDAMRYLLLWRYGGTYLDTDVFVLKSLENERDFAPQDWSGRGLSAVMLDLSWSKLGRRLANATLEETELLQPAAGLHSEADAVLAALTYVCATPNIAEMTMERCEGFRLLDPGDVFPVPFSRWWDIFETHKAHQTMRAVDKGLAVHTWNKLSADAVVATSSSQPFAQIARRVCPGVVAAVGDFM